MKFERSKHLTLRGEQRMLGYALAAGAGMLAAATPAEAGVVYVNPLDQTYTNQNFNLDLNNDGAPDVFFTNKGAYWGRYLWAAGHGIAKTGLWKAAALPGSQMIGPGLSWYGSAKLAGVYPNQAPAGPWANVTNRFLGLRFLINSNVHYGWVRMDVLADPQTLTIAATVKDWAYESVPGRPIHTSETGVIPEPGTLSLLALGAAGLALWRRRKERTE